jgi:hypothetical protein
MYRHVASEGAGGPPDFGPHVQLAPPRFSELATSLMLLYDKAYLEFLGTLVSNCRDFHKNRSYTTVISQDFLLNKK